jgi:hypothetical protein
MPNTLILPLILGAHGLLLMSAVLYGGFSKRRLRPFHYVWMFLTPLFGPVTGWIMIQAIGKTPPGADWIRRNEKSKEMILHQMPMKDMVPLEEALLINDHSKRRTLMMNILRSDPMQYLDLLLVARFNEDTETAHYATATIMELQRQFLLEIQQRQAEIARHEDDFDKHREYVQFLSKFCESGLLEGQLQRRQRLVLKKALDRCLPMREDAVLLRIMVHNSLALKEAAEARTAAQALMDKWPLDETSWLEGMRVCVETRDQAGMQSLLSRMQLAKVDFSSKGREQLLFWTEKRK